MENEKIMERIKIFDLEEYDKNVPLENVIREFSETGYSQEFLKDLKEGFETSTVYQKSEFPEKPALLRNRRFYEQEKL